MIVGTIDVVGVETMLVTWPGLITVGNGEATVLGINIVTGFG